MIEEIKAGLKNAMERGESLDSAVRSFISAGYNQSEVREAAQILSEGASQIISPQTSKQRIENPEINRPKADANQLPAVQSSPSSPSYQQPKFEKKSSSKMVVFLVIILICLMLLGGGLVLLWFNPSLLDFSF